MTTTAEIATIQRRFCAYLIDAAILLIPTLLIVMLFKDFLLILNLLYICLNCSYFTYFISSKAQATPGQQLMNIYTMKVYNSKIDLRLAFDRSISQFFLFLLSNIIIVIIEFFQEEDILISILSILKVSIMLLTIYWYLIACSSIKKQTFHDMLFDTVVVKGAIKS